jgi:hypothetical protein
MGPRQFPPTPLPPRSSLAVLIYAGEETSRLGRQSGRPGGLGCPPPRWHLETSAVSSTMVAGGVGVSVGGHGASTTPPPHPTPVAPSCAGEERPATVSS